MENVNSQSPEIVKKYLGKEVEIIIDRPKGSRHPKHGFEYGVNYGYIPNTKVADGEELDAYYLGADNPLKKVRGVCIAIVHRLNEDDDKLIVAPDDFKISEEEIKKAINFQEKWFKHKIVMKRQKRSKLKLGIYEHYKGKRYKVLGVARHSETLEKMVIYKALYGKRELWTRPLKMFLEEVEINGRKRARFKYIGG